MAVLKNRIGVATTTTGTGTITLGTALSSAVSVLPASWQTFAAGGVANGDTVRYLILDTPGSWEYGPGVFASGPGTITRAAGAMNGTVPGQASSTGALLSLSGTAQVFITAVAEDISSCFVQATTPAGAKSGDFWYDLTGGSLAIFVNDGNSSQWVQVSGGSAGGGNVGNVGTPTVGQVAIWTDATHIQGVAAGDMGARVLVSTLSPAGTSSVSVGPFTSAYNTYEIELLALFGAGDSLWARVSIDGGATFVSSTSYHTGARYASSVGAGGDVPSVGTRMQLTNSFAGGGTSIPITSLIKLIDPARAGVQTPVYFDSVVYESGANAQYNLFGVGMCYVATAVTHFQIFTNGGTNFGANSTIRLYGMK